MKFGELNNVKILFIEIEMLEMKNIGKKLN